MVAGNHGPEAGINKSFTARCIVRGGEFYLLEPAPKMCAFFGTTEASYKNGILDRIRREVSVSSAQQLIDEVVTKADSDEDIRVVYPSKRADGSRCMVQLDAYPGPRTKDGRIYDLIAMDVTEVMEARKTAERLMSENAALTEDSPVGLGIYYINGNHFNLVYTNEEYYHVHHGTKAFWDKFHGQEATDRILAEDRHVVYAEWQKTLRENGHTYNAAYRCLGEDGQIHWVRLLARFKDADANGIHVCYACFLDIDAEKKAEQKLEEQYQSAQAYLDSIASTYLATMRVNLSQNKIEQLGGINSMLSRFNLDDYDALVKKISEQLARQVDKTSSLEHMSCKALLKEYTNGKTHMSYEYLFHPEEGNIFWVRMDIRLNVRLATDDVIAFFAISNINKAKTIDILINDVLVNEYDFIAAVDSIHNSVELLSLNSQSSKIPLLHSGVHYDEIVEKYAHEHMSKEEGEACIKFMSLPNVFAGLEHSDVYSGTFTVMENGIMRQKKLDFSYLDRDSKLLVVVRTDFTDLHKERLEQEHKMLEALNAAKQASLAKSEFLSRMSHEIRTPMNAIIGLDTIALQEKNLSAAMEDHLRKIGISARYLLALINDILDMSRIESGRMLLKNKEFNFHSMVDNINTIIHSQCKERGIDYECTINGFVEEAYVGDELKIQQVLLNILGNAVKFTTSGGKIHFLIEQLSRDNQNARLRFTIADTGKGIAAEFLPHLFDAFTQEDGSATTTYGGTGLGLAISKNIVKLMDGNIDVHSVKGMGTDFTVEVRLGLTDHSLIWQQLQQKMHSLKLDTLIVDDDITVCQHTKLVLDQAGFVAEWVASGAEAITNVQARHDAHRDYNLILVDWKMPDMDGVETVRHLRKIVGPDVTIIILTAYDWTEIEEKARDAGVDNFIRKPIFACSVLKAYQAKKVGKESTATGIPRKQYDFKGKKVLLAEDNLINAEIAKRLLEMVGFDVTHAINGLQVIKKFTAQPAQTFDVILMDIRMPVMDGMEATRIIRSLDKKDAKTIPIVAMSANAFEEDVQKSLESGMNDYLTKPVEAKNLYATLEKILAK
jgi:two-component system sensor histidine kinase/response regulator